MARLQLDISAALKHRLKVHSVNRGESMSVLVEEALEAYLTQLEATNPFPSAKTQSQS